MISIEDTSEYKSFSFNFLFVCHFYMDSNATKLVKKLCKCHFNDVHNIFIVYTVNEMFTTHRDLSQMYKPLFQSKWPQGYKNINQCACLTIKVKYNMSWIVKYIFSTLDTT